MRPPDALLLVDLQTDYFSDEELARCRDDLVSHANELVAAARDAGVPVIEVRTEHQPDRSTWALSMLDDDAGMVLAGTPGARTLDGLDTDGARVVTKTRDSAFHRTDLGQVLREVGASGLVIAGVSTESCIVSTASDAYAHDLRVVLVTDAVASVNPERHDRALDELRMQYRQPSRWASEIVEDWRHGRSAHPALRRD